MKRHGKWSFLFIVLCSVIISSWAEAASDVSSVYSISSDRTAAETKLAFDADADSMLKGFLLERIRKALLKFPYVTSVEIIKGSEINEVIPTLPFDNVKRTSHLLVNFSLGSNIGLLFKTEEVYRNCQKKMPEMPPGVPPMVCQLRSEARLVGPVRVYGLFTSLNNAEDVLQDKQSFSFEAEQSYDKKEVRFMSSMNVLSAQFDQALQSFVKDFGLAGQVSSESLQSRRKVLVATARLFRNLNEGVINEK